jgi:hypothetical protein
MRNARENLANWNRGYDEFMERPVAPGETIQPGDIIAEGPDGVYRTGPPRQLQVPHPTREELNRPMSLRSFAEEFMDTPIPPAMDDILDSLERGTRPVVGWNHWGHSTIAMPQVNVQETPSEYEIITGDEE